MPHEWQDVTSEFFIFHDMNPTKRALKIELWPACSISEFSFSSLAVSDFERLAGCKSLVSFILQNAMSLHNYIRASDTNRRFYTLFRMIRVNNYGGEHLVSVFCQQASGVTAEIL